MIVRDVKLSSIKKIRRRKLFTPKAFECTNRVGIVFYEKTEGLRWIKTKDDLYSAKIDSPKRVVKVSVGNYKISNSSLKI